MTKQYPSKQYLSEVISNREFAESVPPEIVIVMARQLLASMEQEPVYQVLGDGSWTDYSKQQLEDLLESKPSTLFRVAYAAPQLPQPAVVLPVQHWEELCRQHPDMSIGDAIIRAAWWNHCAAMLQGEAIKHPSSNEGASQPYTLRDGWVAVPVDPTEEILDEFDSIIDYGAEDSKDAWSRLLAAAWIKSLPAAPQQEEPNRIQEERANVQEEMAMGARLTKHRFKVK